MYKIVMQLENFISREYPTDLRISNLVLPKRREIDPFNGHNHKTQIEILKNILTMKTIIHCDKKTFYSINIHYTFIFVLLLQCCEVNLIIALTWCIICCTDYILFINYRNKHGTSIRYHYTKIK